MAAVFALLFGVMSSLSVPAAAAPAANPPVAKLDQVAGQVEYSRDGKQWRPLTRAKYLFSGYLVRTGATGSAMLLNQSTGESQSLAADSTIRVTASGVQVVRGKLSAPEGTGSSFWSALVNKFTKAQRYTTVRRTAIAPCKVDTASRLTVSEAYPEIVWRNAGPDCAYRLTLGSQVIEVPVSSTAEMIRYRLPAMPVGDHPFKVEVVAAGVVVNPPTSTSTLHWQTAEEAAKFAAEEQRVRAANDDVLLASFYEDQGMLVPAMDTLRNFIQANPDENELRPLLIKTYSDLRLDDLKEKESRAFQAASGS